MLQLPYVSAAIVGVRLDAGSEHRRETLAALSLDLTTAEIALIDEALARGTISDGLARANPPM